MKLKEVIEFVESSKGNEVSKMIEEKRIKLVELRFKQAIGGEVKVSECRNLKKQLAHIKTSLNKK